FFLLVCFAGPLCPAQWLARESNPRPWQPASPSAHGLQPLFGVHAVDREAVAGVDHVGVVQLDVVSAGLGDDLVRGHCSSLLSRSVVVQWLAGCRTQSLRSSWSEHLPARISVVSRYT